MSELFWTTIPFTKIPIVVVVGLIGLWMLLRNKATKLSSGADFDAVIGGGRPVVMEFFSNT